MEGRFSTGQSPKWSVVPIEEEEEKEEEKKKKKKEEEEEEEEKKKKEKKKIQYSIISNHDALNNKPI